MQSLDCCVPLSMIFQRFRKVFSSVCASALPSKRVIARLIALLVRDQQTSRHHAKKLFTTILASKNFLVFTWPSGTTDLPWKRQHLPCLRKTCRRAVESLPHDPILYRYRHFHLEPITKPVGFFVHVHTASSSDSEKDTTANVLSIQSHTVFGYAQPPCHN